MFAMTAFGVGEIVGGPVISFIIKKTKSNRWGLVYHFILSSIGWAFFLAYIGMYRWTCIAFFFCFFFGVMDSSSCTHFGMILGFEFEGKAVNAYGWYNLFKAATIGYMCFVLSEVDHHWEYSILGGIMCGVYLASYVIVFVFFPFKKVQ